MTVFEHKQIVRIPRELSYGDNTPGVGVSIIALGNGAYQMSSSTSGGQELADSASMDLANAMCAEEIIPGDDVQ